MTSYHGGKQRIGLQIAEYIHYICSILPQDIEINGYCEPFVGMCGVYRYIPGLFDDKKDMKYLAGDTNESVIKMWIEVQKGWRPPVRTTEAEYNRLRENPASALRGYIGHQYSFGGQFFMGYSTKYGKTPDSTRASNNVVEIGKCLGDVEFKYGSYKQFSNLKRFIIYCDPPYENSSQRYTKLDGFVSEEFWDWCREMSKENIIFVSSYEAPKDFIEVMSSSHKLTGIIHSNAPRKRVEKLFLLIT
jgi:DNA adenine methylase